MPRGNATGPMGMGPRTGRGMGLCSGYARPGFMNNSPAPGFGAGFGFGYGYGRGFGGGGRGFGGGGRGRRNQYWAMGRPGGAGFGWSAAPYGQPDPEFEKQFLKNQADALQSDLDIIRKRLNEFETGSPE